MDKVLAVLSRVGAPVHVSELSRLLHGEGWGAVQAGSLDALLSARLAMDIRMAGSRSPIEMVAPSTFSLRGDTARPAAQPPSEVVGLITRLAALKDPLVFAVLGMTGRELLARLMRARS